jgi:hypothetical protein
VIAGLCGCRISFQEREPMCGVGENGIEGEVGEKEDCNMDRREGREGDDMMVEGEIVSICLQDLRP